MSMPPSSRARCSRLTHVSACGSTLRSSARCAGHAHDGSSSDLRACALFSHTIELDLFGSSRSECAPRLRHSTQCCAPGRSALPLVAVGPRANVATTSSTTARPCCMPISTLCPATATRTAHANGRRSRRGLRGSASAGRQLPSVSTSRSAPRSSSPPPPRQVRAWKSRRRLGGGSSASPAGRRGLVGKRAAAQGKASGRGAATAPASAAQ
mmetsp:Transcript_13860/g.46703  ORF Transcript_13860/g.46703 Transcript_13860/m.46703 type:complete len:211 (-) Transcript_13860:373-1005(-)